MVHRTHEVYGSYPTQLHCNMHRKNLAKTPTLTLTPGRLNATFKLTHVKT